MLTVGVSRSPAVRLPRRYPEASNSRKITFEYVMLKSVNDSVAEAAELVRLLRGIPALVNLIPVREQPGTVCCVPPAARGG